MLNNLPVQHQLEMFKTVLESFFNPDHELCLIAEEIDWASPEKEFAPLYGPVGRPSMPTFDADPDNSRTIVAKADLQSWR